MRAFVAVTDKDWYQFLAGRLDLDEVNFWQPGGNRVFRTLKPGEPLLFKLHYPDNASWEPDAMVMDRAAGVFADPSRVHRIEHEGRFFRSRGPLNVVRSSQGGPAILQAGTSPKGRTFAARYADAIFAIQPNIAGAKAYYDDIKRGTVSEGRARPRPARSCSASSRFSGRRRPRRARSRRSTTSSCRSRVAWRSSRATSTSICRRCRSTR